MFRWSFFLVVGWRSIIFALIERPFSQHGYLKHISAWCKGKCTVIITLFFASWNNWHVSFSCPSSYPKSYYPLQTWCLLVNVSTTRWYWSGRKLKNSRSCLLNIQHLQQHKVPWSVLCCVFLRQTVIVWNSNFLDWIPRVFCLCSIRMQWYSSKLDGNW